MGCWTLYLGAMMSDENTQEIDQSIDVEMRQLKQIAQEIDEAQALPLSPEEQAQYDDAERVESINSAAMEVHDAEYTAAVAAGVAALWGIAAPNWTLEEAELMPMAQLTKMVIDKHFPNALEKAGPEVMLGMVCLTAITARVKAGIPPRGPLPEERPQNDES